ncbi:hypothetical protein FHT00_002686 [Sphingomonas insulae]|nr:hypothetical protein [Sphingomonas insulae]NIJ30715.1 hypothetical protein [Sphingomonas insulae]
MRKVRLSYSWTDRSLEHCLVETSSGDANIDRIMCRILGTCVKQGHAKIDKAKRCMNRRVDTLIEEARRVGNDRIAPVSDDLADEMAASPPQAVTIAPVTAGEGDEIVVEGQRNPIRGALWQIERTNVFRSGGAGEMPESSAYHFNLCLPDTSVRQMLDRAANERLQRPGMKNCGPMDLAMDSEFAILRLTCSGGIRRQRPDVPWHPA